MRADLALVERGLARSRSQAASLINDGRVLYAGRELRKPATEVTDLEALKVVAGIDFVSRAGHKLDGALDHFAELEVQGKVCLDVGASTGGFTDVLLRRGASQVIAIDVGHEQMVPELRENSSVACIEGFNARELSPETLAERLGASIPEIQLVVADLSFISLTLVLEQMLSVAPKADFVLLIKPQFEVGKQSLQADGVVTSHLLRAEAIRQVVDHANKLKMGIRGLERSSLPGTHGNIEYVLWISPAEKQNSGKWSQAIESLAKGGARDE